MRYSLSFILCCLSTPLLASPIGFNSETGQLGDDFTPIQSEPDALAGRAISSSTSILGNSPDDPARLASYSLEIPAGTYELYARFRVGSAGTGADSFFVGHGFGVKTPNVDSDWFVLNSLSSTVSPSIQDIEGSFISDGEWSWVNLTQETSVGNFTSSGGTETFIVGGREAGLDLDAFAFVPSGQAVDSNHLFAAVMGQPIRDVAALNAFTRDAFPQTVAFRTTERALSNNISFWNNDLEIQGTTPITLDDFSRDMQRWDIIIGKALREERTANMERVIEGYGLLKENSPEKLVLLHFNGRNRRQDFFTHENQPFFPGHWLHRLPSVCRNDIAATAADTVIQVDDLSRYVGNNGVLLRNLEFTLYEVIAGVRNFSHAEYVGAVSPTSFDLAAGTITVRRGLHNTTPLAFNTDQCEIAQQTVIGSRYQYNWGSSCPLDPQGRTCYEVLAQEIASRFGVDGALHAFDGIIFDAMSFTTVNDRFDDYDINMDGVIDPQGFLSTTGLFDHWTGFSDFGHRLRELLGEDFIIMGDSRTPSHHRNFALFNGTESEEWPHPDTNTTFFKHWSSGIARHQFLETRLREPRLHYFNPRVESRAEERLVQVAAACVDAPVITEYRWRLNTEEVLGYTDEMSRGLGFEFNGWLGEPLGPMVRMAETPGNLIASETRTNFAFTPSNENTDGANAALAGHPTSTITIADIPNPGEELYFKVRLRADAFADYDSGIPRDCYLTVERTGNEKIPLAPGLLSDLVATPNAYVQNCHVDEQGVEYGFSFRWLNTETVRLTLSIEGHEPATLERLEVYNSPDAVYREFENGIVLGNPSSNPVDFDLGTLFPGRQFRRIQGYLRDELESNGTPAIGIVTIPPFDGLMLTTDTGEQQTAELRAFSFGQESSSPCLSGDPITYSFKRRLPDTYAGNGLSFKAAVSDDMLNFDELIDLDTEAFITPDGDNLYETLSVILPINRPGLTSKRQFLGVQVQR